MDALVLLRPPAIADATETLLPFVGEGRRRGVRHVVFSAVAGAEKNKLLGRPPRTLGEYFHDRDTWRSRAR